MRRNFRQFVDDNRGAVLAEAAIVFPLLVLMLAATAEFGRFFYTYNSLAKATRVSARYISNKQLNNPQELIRARNIAIYGNINGTGTPILPNLSAANILITDGEDNDSDGMPDTADGTPELITVQIANYTYQPIFAVGPLANLAGVQVDPGTTMKYLVTTPTL